MNLRYSKLPPLGNACGSPILKIICPWHMSIDQCSSPKALIIPYHLAVWAAKAPLDQTYITYTSVSQYRPETRWKREVWLTFPLSSNQPPETLDWRDEVQESQEWEWESGITNSYCPLHIFTSTDNLPWPFSAWSTGQKEAVWHLWQNYPILFLESHCPQAF